MKSGLENALPNEIVIGPFRVNVQPLKCLLVQKRQNCSTQLLTMFTESLRTRINDVLTDYSQINVRLKSPSRSIEHLFEEQNWLATIPQTIKPLDEVMQKLTREFDVLDYFRWNLSDQDFEAKWRAIGSSHQVRLLVRVAYYFPIDYKKDASLLMKSILKKYCLSVFEQTEEAEKRFTSEYEKFHKLQVQDEIILSEKVNMLVGNVANLTLQTDVDKIHETAIEAKRIWKAMKESRETGLLLNKRQELFGTEVVMFDQLDELTKEFEPYLTLWVAASGNRIPITTIIQPIRERAT